MGRVQKDPPYETWGTRLDPPHETVIGHRRHLTDPRTGDGLTHERPQFLLGHS